MRKTKFFESNICLSKNILLGVTLMTSLKIAVDTKDSK